MFNKQSVKFMMALGALTLGHGSIAAAQQANDAKPVHKTEIDVGMIQAKDKNTLGIWEGYGAHGSHLFRGNRISLLTEGSFGSATSEFGANQGESRTVGKLEVRGALENGGKLTRWVKPVVGVKLYDKTPFHQEGLSVELGGKIEKGKHSITATLAPMGTYKHEDRISRDFVVIPVETELQMASQKIIGKTGLGSFLELGAVLERGNYKLKDKDVFAELLGDSTYLRAGGSAKLKWRKFYVRAESVVDKRDLTLKYYNLNNLPTIPSQMPLEDNSLTHMVSVGFSTK